MTLRIIANALNESEATNWATLICNIKNNKDVDWSKLKNFDQVYKNKVDKISLIYFIYLTSQWLIGICAFISLLFFLIGASLASFNANKNDAIYFWIVGIIFLILFGLFILINLIFRSLTYNKHQLKEIDAYYDSLKIKFDSAKSLNLPQGILNYLVIRNTQENIKKIKLSVKQWTIMKIQIYKMMQIIVASWY